MAVVHGGGQWHSQSRNIFVMLTTGGGNQEEQWMDGRKAGAAMEEGVGVNLGVPLQSFLLLWG